MKLGGILQRLQACFSDPSNQSHGKKRAVRPPNLPVFWRRRGWLCCLAIEQPLQTSVRFARLLWFIVHAMEHLGFVSNLTAILREVGLKCKAWFKNCDAHTRAWTSLLCTYYCCRALLFGCVCSGRAWVASIVWVQGFFLTLLCACRTSFETQQREPTRHTAEHLSST